MFNKSTAMAATLMTALLLSLAAAAAGPDAMAPAPGATTALPKIADAVDPKNDTLPIRVNSVNIYGNTRIATSQLLQAIAIKPGDLMAKDKMGAALDSIVAQYRARGWDVAVRPRVSHPKQNFVDVNFLIDEQGSGGHD